MNGRDRDAIVADPSPYPPRYGYHDHHRDPWREVQEQADHDLAERTVRAIYNEGN